jgi:hypothetical protein
MKQGRAAWTAEAWTCVPGSDLLIIGYGHAASDGGAVNDRPCQNSGVREE